jgi:hypothetical protein
VGHAAPIRPSSKDSRRARLGQLAAGSIKVWLSRCAVLEGPRPRGRHVFGSADDKALDLQMGILLRGMPRIVEREQSGRFDDDREGRLRKV